MVGQGMVKQMGLPGMTPHLLAILALAGPGNCCLHLLVFPGIARHCCFRQPGEEIQIGPNWDLSKALNNRYRLLLLRIDRYPRHFGVLLIKIHLLAFVVVAIKWIIRPKTKKNLFS